MDKFKIGDIVYHKSNPNQTMVIVTASEESVFHKCRWIDIKGRVCMNKFMDFELEDYEKLLNYFDANKK